MAKPRRRNFARDTQKGKMDEAESTKKEDTKAGKSNNGIIIILIIMIGVTWGIAATAYFGVVDYKGLVVSSTKLQAIDAADYVSALYPFQYDAVRHPLRAIGSVFTYIDDTITNLFLFERALFEISDKRRIVTSTPVNKFGYSKKDYNMVKRDAETEPATKLKNENVIKDEVEKVKSSKKSEQDKAKPESTKKSKPKTATGADDKKPVVENKQEKQKDKKKKPKTLSDEDQPILDKLKEGEKLLAQKKGEKALQFFQNLVKANPKSPKAAFNKARAEELTSEQQRSNPLLMLAIKSFGEVAEMQNAPKELKKQALLAKSEKEMFLGRMKPALETQLALSKIYPQDIEVLNKLGVRFLMLGRNKAAREVYDKVLKLKPDDGFAQVHMGFIVKNAGEWAAAIPLLSQGTESGEPGTQEGKFYFHLGDALHRTNRTEEAEKIYEKAAKKGLFRSKYQRSLYNVDRLRGKPFWTPEEAGVQDYVRRLEMNWKLIRDEAMAFINEETGSFQLEEESLRDTGEWRQFTIYQRGMKNDVNCRKTPKTCKIVERMPNAKGCRRGQIKYSVMMPGTHVWPHTGPTNCRLRMHLGLVIPKTGSGARLACAGEMRTWQEGKVLIFDDSFEHEVWQEAESLRLILIVDIWHPDLTEHEKETLTSI